VLECHLDDRLDVQVRADRLAAGGRANQEGLVRLEAMEGESILVAVDGHGAQAEFSGGTEAPDGNLRAVGYEQFPHIWQRTLRSLSSRKVAWTKRGRVSNEVAPADSRARQAFADLNVRCETWGRPTSLS